MDNEIKQLKDKITLLEELLSETQDLLYNINCYETEIYKKISHYFFTE